MEALLLLSLNATIEDTSNLLYDTNQLAEEYFKNWTSLTIVSKNFEAWSTLQFAVPVILKYFPRSPTSLRSTSVILDLTGDADSAVLTSLKWTDSTKFIVLADESKLDRISSLLWSTSACNFLAVSPKNFGLTVFDHYYNHCDEPPVLMKSDAPIANLSIQPCFQNRLFNVSFLNFPPFLIYKKGHRMSGTEGHMIETVADQLKFNINWVNRHETEWGRFHPPEGLFGDVSAGSSIMGLGALVMNIERYKNTDFLLYSTFVELQFAVPTGAGKRHPTWFIILVSEFSRSIWLLIMFLFCVLIVVSAAINYTEKGKAGLTMWIFHNFGLLLGVPRGLIQPRVLTITSVCGGFLLTTHYQSMMSSKLTAPAKIPEITTLKQLADSNMAIHGPYTVENLIKNMALETGDRSVIAMSNRYNNLSMAFDDYLPHIVQDRKLAVLRHSMNLLYIASRNPETAGRIHIVEQEILTFLSTTLIKKNSCLKKHAQKVFLQVQASGLHNKWLRDANPNRKTIDTPGPRKLSLNDIKGFLMLLTFGWALSVISLIGELVTYRVSSFTPVRKFASKLK